MPNEASGNDSSQRIFAFDLTDEIAMLKSQPMKSGRATRALVGLPSLRVLLVWMEAGARWDEHIAPGRITVQVLAGCIQISASGQSVDLSAGHLAALDTRVPHDVDAIEESMFLLTVDRDD